jgi:hypothetical protein
MNKLILFFLLLPLTEFCQVTDDFTDGDFTNTPAWVGDASKFEVNSSKQLHLNTTGADTAILCTTNSLVSNTEWRFWVKLSFQTSGNNNARVYLVSNQQNIAGSLNGYFVQVGETDDSIALFKQTGTTLHKIIPGTVAYTNNSTNILRIRVTRDNSGNWSLYSDPIGGNAFQLEGTGFDNTFTTTSWFGVFCKYTTSNAAKFYFDDFYVGPIIVDVTPPTVSSVLVISPTQLDIIFSENVSTITAENIANYSVNTGIGNPATAIKDGTNGSLVHLTFASSFIAGTSYTITISNVQDLSNNTMTPDSRAFALYTPKAYDVLINEIFPDPDPQVGLPDYEYAELYNHTLYPLNLKNWKLTVGMSVKVFPSVVIEPDSFLILTSAVAQSFFTTYGPVVGFSSFSLTNSGQTLILSDSLDHIIHVVTYSDTWYQDAGKANGGWSLELIDPANPCGDATNWIASIDPAGGTPGKKNSVFSSNPDNIHPQLSNINVISASCIQLNFSEPLDSTSLVNLASYSIDHGIGTPTSISLVKPDYRKVILYIGSALQQNILYTCTVSGAIKDCAGNTTVTTSSTFALYDAKQFDVVINEIMADPDPPVGLANYEYVELYNRTIYPISMKGWKFQMGTSLENIPDATINPHAYLLLTATDGEAAISSYGDVLGVSSFAITNTGETLSLYDSSSRTISTVSFTDAWYQDSYKKNGGWSLEQIDPMNPCGDASNWRPSNSMLGGTPAMVNSINASNPDNTAPQLVRVSLINNNRIQVYFTEPLDSTYLQHVTNYTIGNGIGNPITADPISPDYKSVVLDFSPAVQTGTIYTITVTDTLKDCVGNMLPINSSARFAIPELPIANDLVINEVLSHPKDDGIDYVELYNRSNKVIDLKQLVLSSYDTITSMLTDVNDISVDGYLVFPEDYVVLTTDPVMVKKQYNTPNPNGFAQMPSLPSLNNDDGVVALSLKNLVIIIDKFTYTANIYYPLLTSTAGVSLERINFNRPTNDKTNWHSAAETAGFGTPAYKNSQYSEGVASADPVSVSPEIFSPDNDGKDDVLNINYKFDVAGYIVNINVYDASGRLIRNLVKNELLGTSGNFSWDGITNDNEKARIGIYIIYFEVFDMNGNLKHYKKSAVLASKL